MKVFILPYTFRTFFSYHKRASGIDQGTLCQVRALQDAGHDVRLYTAFTDLHQHMNGIDYYRDTIPEGMEVKDYEKSKRSVITQELVKSIREFGPDVILSNYLFNNYPYDKLMGLDIPIIFSSMTNPGFWSDLSSVGLMHDFCTQGHTFINCSDYHKMRTDKFYARWPEANVTADDILFCAYSERETVQPSDGSVRHCSAANTEKSTFYIHDVFDETEVYTEVYTAFNYLNNNSKNGKYIQKNMDRFKDMPDRKTLTNIDHGQMVQEIGKSACTFVGIAPYDTFTITSLESLSRGVPVLVKNYKGLHPAKEMLPEAMKEYVHIFENKADLLAKTKEWSTLTVETRQSIADACYDMTSKAAYTQQLELICSNAIEKYKNNLNNGLHLDQFMI